MRLKEKLQGVVPEECLSKLSDRFHVIGNIAILSLAPELLDLQEGDCRGSALFWQEHSYRAE